MNKLIFMLLLASGVIYAKSSGEEDSLCLYQTSLNIADCDACGCSVNGNSSGFDGLLTNQYIGLKYFFQHYKVKENIFVKEPTQNEYYRSLQLTGKIPVFKKLVMYAIVPYQFNIKESSPEQEIKGIGDITVIGSYYIFNDRLNSAKLPHRVLLNIGLKMPTGKFNTANAAGINPSFQIGTGSWDILTSLNYQFIKEKFAIQFNTDYILKNKNNKNYKYGNQWNSALMGYYFIRWGRIGINPKMGITTEVYQSNRQLDEDLPGTSGEVIFGKSGVELSYRKWMLGTDISLPVYANLSNNEIKPISRFAIFINFNF